MKTLSILRLPLLLASTNAISPVYKADIAPLSGSGVTGIAVVYSNDASIAGYAGFASGLVANLAAPDCMATNGCGVHIHSGLSCEDTSAQGGHYFVDPVSIDPWINERYSTKADGLGSFGGALDIGTSDLSGRAFLIHDASGARVGCGLLQRVEESKLLMGVSDGSVGLATINNSGATGEVTVYQPNDDYVCYYGKSQGLTADVDSFLDGGIDCTNTNGCGAHIHSGTSCEDSSTQGGHFYSTAADPWITEGYDSTSADGSAFYVGCVATGETIFKKKPFIVHEENGSRAACGLLEACTTFRQCKTFQGGSGLWMTRGITPQSFTGSFGCRSVCMPSLFIRFASFFGFSCGRCVD